jgi:hypothetical protein
MGDRTREMVSDPTLAAVFRAGAELVIPG